MADILTTFQDDSVKARFWDKVDLRSDGECWNWKGTLSSTGYGSIAVKHKNYRAHRVAYLLSGKLIPGGLVLDHLCRNRACVNPSHLEAVTPKENTLRGFGPTASNLRASHCKRGHPLVAGNLLNYSSKLGWRACKACALERKRLENRRYRAKKKALALAQACLKARENADG